MKMKRYFAADSRQAMRELREDQGPDAVILSNRRVNGGVEIIAAMDYEDAMVNASLGNPNALKENTLQENTNEEIDPYRNSLHNQQANTGYEQNASLTAEQYSAPVSQANNNPSALDKIQDELTGLRNIMEAPLMQFSWGETGRVSPLYANLLKQLMTLGISSALSRIIASKLEKQGLSKHSWLESLNYLANLVPVKNEDILTEGGTVSLIGPTGVGKTTTIAKLAARFALKHGRRSVTLITTDSYRIGAHEQLRGYGRILGIPVHIASEADELKNLLDEINDNSEEPHLTLIDTAGVCQKDVRLADQITAADFGEINIKNYLVLSATGQMNLQDEVITGFKKLDLEGCIITKIDEAASLGEIISVIIQHKLPVSFICDGQKVPDNLYRARGRLLVKEAVKLMRNLKNSKSDEELAYSFGGATINGNG